MIRYDLKCTDGHVFEAWFASSTAFEEQAAAGLVGCVECRVAAPDGGDGVPELAPILKQTCQDLGLILRPYNNLLIFSPPLTITRAQIATMFDLLEQGIRIGTQELEGQGYRPD